MVALERVSRGRVTPVVEVCLLNRLDGVETPRVGTWLLAGRDLEAGLLRGLTNALEQSPIEGRMIN